MSTRYDEILARGARRRAGLPDDDARDPYDDILERGRERAQSTAIARARTVTRPGASAAPADAVARGVSAPEPAFGDSEFRGAGGGVDFDDGRGFFKNLGRSAYDAAVPGAIEALGGTARTVGEALPGSFSFQGAKRGLDALGSTLENYGGARRLAPPRVSSISDALESGANARDYLGSTLGQGLGSSAPTIVGALAGGLPGAVLGSYTQQVGEVRGEFDKVAPDMDPGDRARATLGLAAPLAALDIVPEAFMAKRAQRAVSHGVGDWLAEQTAREIAGKVGKSMLTGAAAEGITEAAQEGGQYFGVRKLAGKESSWAEGGARMLDAGIAGALPGAFMGGTAAGVEQGANAFRRRGIGETTMEPWSGIIPKQLKGEVDNDPDFTVEPLEGPLDPSTPPKSPAEAPPRPGNVPETPEARARKPRKAPTPAPDIASALDQQVAMAQEQATALTPPDPMTEVMAEPDIAPTPEELQGTLDRGAVAMGAAEAPMTQPPEAPVPQALPAEAPPGNTPVTNSEQTPARQSIADALDPTTEAPSPVTWTKARITPTRDGVKAEVIPEPKAEPAPTLTKFEQGALVRHLPTGQVLEVMRAHEGGGADLSRPASGQIERSASKDQLSQFEHVAGPLVVRDLASGRTEKVEPKAPQQKGDQPNKPSPPPVSSSGQLVLPNNNVIQFPSGKWGFAGNVARELYYKQDDGSPLTDDQWRGLKQSGPGFVRGIKRVAFDTRAEAEAALEAAQSGTSPAGAPARSDGSVQDGRRTPDDNVRRTAESNASVGRGARGNAGATEATNGRGDASDAVRASGRARAGDAGEVGAGGTQRDAGIGGVPAGSSHPRPTILPDAGNGVADDHARRPDQADPARDGRVRPNDSRSDAVTEGDTDGSVTKSVSAPTIREGATDLSGRDDSRTAEDGDGGPGGIAGRAGRKNTEQSGRADSVADAGSTAGALSRIEQQIRTSADRAFIQREVDRHESYLDAGLSTPEETKIAKAVVRTGHARLKVLDKQGDTDVSDVRSDAAVPGTPDAGGVRPGVAGQPVGERAGDVSRDAGERPAAGSGRGDGDSRAGGNDGAVETDGRTADTGRTDAAGVSDAAEARGARGSDGESRGAAGRVVAATDRPGLTNWRYQSWQELLEGGPVAKAKNNLAAIALALQIEGEQRPATREEQATLAKFVGWGPLSKFFDPKTPSDRRISDDLQRALGWADYDAAKKATRNSHYTDPRVVQAIYTLVERLGVKGGTFLEPSVGSGLFLGMMPEGLSNTVRWIASDLDPTTARIARLLYPQAAVHTVGFQQLAIPDNSIDVAISNVPFGNYPVRDKGLPKFVTQQIHDYFFARALQKVRPGGLLVFITSAGTMDKRDAAVRSYLQQQGAKLVTSIRLPAGAFADIARTEVTTDLIVLQKDGTGDESPWRNSVSLEQDGETYQVNEYYRDHPTQMLGVLSKAGSMYRADQQELSPREGEDLQQALAAAIARAPKDVYTPAAPREKGAKPAPVKVHGVAATVRVGSFQLGPDGAVLVRKADGMEAAKVSKGNVAKVKHYIELRDAYRAAMQHQVDDAPKKQIEASLATLNRLYDGFVKAYGPINLEEHKETKGVDEQGAPAVRITYPNLDPLDAEWPLVSGLEEYDHDAYMAKQPGAVQKAAALRGRVIFKAPSATSAATPVDALALSLNETGRVSEPRIADLLGIDEAAVEEALGDTVMRNPDSGQLEPRGLYLSGDVKDKLALAEAAARQDRRFERNVEALQKVQPPDIPSAYIPARIGQTWIPAEVYRDFLSETFRVRATLRYIPALGKWEMPKVHANNVAATQTYGTEDMNGVVIFTTLLEGGSIEVTDPPAEKGGRPTKNADKTALALAKAEALKEHFNAWLWKDATRAESLAQLYNDRFNRVIEPEWDGSHLTTPGVTTSLNGTDPYAWLPHQKNGIYRYVAKGNTALVYDVGAGKTFTMAGIAMEARRLGMARRPVVTYPNNLLAQWPREAQALYPGANILAVTEDDLKDKDARQAFAARMQAGDYDMILMPESVFVKVGMSADAHTSYIQEQIDEYQRVKEEMEGAKEKGSRSYKQLLNQLEKLEVRLEEKINAESKDTLLTWEELGADLLIVDEVHRYKNLFFPTSREGMSGTQSQRSTDFYLKTRHMHRVNPGRGLVLASGTIVANNIAPELYAMQKYLQPDTLGAAGIQHFDAWLTQFAEEKQELEQKANGAFEYVKKIDEWTAIPELQQLFRQVFDIQMATTDTGGEDRRGYIKLKRPPRLNDRATIVEVPGSDRMASTMRWIADEYERIKKLKKEEREGEPIIPTLVQTGGAAAIDFRLAFANAEDSPTSKLSVAAKEIAQRWKDTSAFKGTQIVFLDVQNSMKTGVPGFHSHRELMRKLHDDYGIPRAQMASVALAKDRTESAAMVRDANAGKVRIIIGTTDKMGVGTNLQKNTTTIHHIDVPYRPDQLEQRNGRAIRQGHKLWEAGTIPGVEEVRYATVGSLDAFKWGKVERKAKAITGVMAPATARGVEDVDVDGDGSADEIAQIKAIASGNPYLLEAAQIAKETKRLEGMRRAEADNATKTKENLRRARADLATYSERVRVQEADTAQWSSLAGDAFTIRVNGETYTERKAAAEALGKVVADGLTAAEAHREVPIGRIGPFQLSLTYERGYGHRIELAGSATYPTSHFERGFNVDGLLKRVENAYEDIPHQLTKSRTWLATAQAKEADYASFQYGGFSKAVELDRLRARKTEIDRLLLASGKSTTPAVNDSEEDGDGVEERMAYSDPVSAMIGEAIRAIRSRMKDRAADTEPLFRSNFEEVEARLAEAEKGLPSLDLRDKLRASLRELRGNFTRHFPALDPNRDSIHAMAHELLLNAERSGSWAKAMAADRLLSVVTGLTKGDVQTMARTLALDDILKDLDNGLYSDGRELPFGYASRAEVEEDARDAHAAVQSSVNVAAATERRAAMAQALTTRLVEIDALPESVLDDPRYFHRQVLSYARARLEQQKVHGAGVGAPREVRQRTRGFQRGRVGGGDFNLAYQESEYEWVANAYQVIALHEILAAMKQLADITPSLKAQANALNLNRFYEIALPEGITRADLVLNPKADPLFGFRSKIAMAMQRLTKSIANGDVTLPPQFDGAVRSLLESERGGGKGFAHPQFWAMLSTLVAGDYGDASISAATIFKAVRERKEFVKTTLGKDFIDPTDPDALVELAGDQYAVWQPEKGNLFFSALTVPEKAVIEGTLGSLEGDQLRRAMVMGGRKPAWIVPVGIAATLNNLTPAKAPSSKLDELLKKEVRLWKQWTLLSPFRAIKYNFNNLSGDVDAALLAPGVFKHVPDAARDLWHYMQKRDVRRAVTDELQEAIRLGVMDQGQAAAEIPDVIDLPGFEALAKATPYAFSSLIGGYWKHARTLTQLRENVLRLAAYRYFQAEGRAGRRRYAASNPSRVDAVRGLNERAALLARDLVGDYGNISVAGETIRDRVIPFYSWIEVNAKRYVNYFRNLPLEEHGAAAAAGRGAAAVASRLGLGGMLAAIRLGATLAVGAAAAAGFLTLVALWNATMHPKEWEEMRRTGRDGQLILGTRDDGTIISIRAEGAFADFLGWVGMKDIASDIRDVANGKMGYGDLVTDALMAPVNKIAAGWEPTTKALASFASGKQFFPEPLNPIPVRDPLSKPYGVFFDQWSIGWAYRHVVAPLAGAPPVPDRPGNPILGMLLYQTDAGELAYRNVQTQVVEWREKHGKESGSADPTARSNALYYFKKSTQWGEQEAADAWLQRYYTLGGTRESVRESVKRADPLGGLAKKDQHAFLASRSKEELAQLDRAKDWYRRTMLESSGQSVRTVRKADAPADTSWIKKLGDEQRRFLTPPPTR